MFTIVFMFHTKGLVFIEIELPAIGVKLHMNCPYSGIAFGNFTTEDTERSDFYCPLDSVCFL